ncbi:uncharacterized protein EDB91DRAFT_1165613 [Suillus paluster]|uniref:uncharacterized protein n=1 Tax=Suillus paluster TaxID=48578 RepID=UPI001B881C26|nr:uncharacterized protein EDB91DRAFT_1165613 [Suillus paluster]KAG1726785.1 hypothetical protein EDB91DRAFT_1165613 [Suillus paluster]
MNPLNLRRKFNRFRTLFTGRGRGHRPVLDTPSPSSSAPSPSSVDPSSRDIQSAASPPSMDPSTIKEKCGRFRILIIGRANAGKTTILQRVCNTRENPEIYNSAGEKVGIMILVRGEHDIENEMVFRSNPRFVFHDSRGFEAGGQSEFNTVKAFIADRSKRTSLKDRLHVIWYCIPMNEACRSFTEGEIKFFSHCDTGSIPVIVLFTKFDALHTIEFAQLKRDGASRKDAKELAPKRAEESFANGSQLKFLYNPNDIGRPPKCHVCLPSKPLNYRFMIYDDS